MQGPGAALYPAASPVRGAYSRCTWIQLKKVGLEPDECYVIGDRDPPRPDLAIEVMWSQTGLSKLEIYRRLAVPEVWVWRGGGIEVHVLAGDEYVLRPRSQLLPDLDLDLLLQFLDVRRQTHAVRQYRETLRKS